MKIKNSRMSWRKRKLQNHKNNKNNRNSKNHKKKVIKNNKCKLNSNRNETFYLYLKFSLIDYYKKN